ncbi:MAG: hypothetical protein CND43_02860 [Flavobacteriales bacterium MED-G15]|nr:MAG: hypothetical protein CND43_02860 [Flavobacteriales bacterium MED-G15]|tara:strand:+ start:528 stop:737 length:210 start_codon:yes stop_codon:yes gene_type:complete
MKIDIEHYKICLLNNAGIQKKIEYLLREEFKSYCNRKKITYTDSDEMEDDYKEVLDTSMQTLLHDLNDW